MGQVAENLNGDLNGDGWQDLVITINNGAPRCFLQRPTTERKPFAVRLRGTRGNENAIGARVVAKDDSGKNAARLVSAGEGYLTQRPPTIFFSERPTELTVYWPDGNKSEHALTAQHQFSVELKHPSLP